MSAKVFHIIILICDVIQLSFIEAIILHKDEVYQRNSNFFARLSISFNRDAFLEDEIDFYPDAISRVFQEKLTEVNAAFGRRKSNFSPATFDFLGDFTFTYFEPDLAESVETKRQIAESIAQTHFNLNSYKQCNRCYIVIFSNNILEFDRPETYPKIRPSPTLKVFVL